MRYSLKNTKQLLSKIVYTMHILQCPQAFSLLLVYKAIIHDTNKHLLYIWQKEMLSCFRFYFLFITFFLGNRKIIVIIVYLFLTDMDGYLCLMVWYYQVWNINNIFWRSVACNMILVISVTSLWMHPTLTWQQPAAFRDENWWYTEMPYRFFKPIN